MASGSPREDIDALLDEASDQLELLRQIYEETLTHQNPTAKLRVRIKNILENQRSSLDHLAHAIVERDGKTGSKTYYPFARHVNDFPRTFDRTMPGVAASRPDIKKVIKHRQPFRPGYEWLGHLSTLTNENKHERLTPQTRSGRHRAMRAGTGGGHIAAPGAATVVLAEGASITNITGDPVFDFGGRPVRVHNISEVLYHDWLFTTLNISVMGTLTLIDHKLPLLIDDVCDVAGL